jgi:hypothetical protein
MKITQPGPTVITAGAEEFCSEHGIDPSDLFNRHLNGDWGKLCQEDRDQNEEMVKHRGMIMSSYELPEGKLWIITDPAPSPTEPHHATTLLLPSEY